MHGSLQNLPNRPKLKNLDLKSINMKSSIHIENSQLNSEKSNLIIQEKIKEETYDEKYVKNYV